MNSLLTQRCILFLICFMATLEFAHAQEIHETRQRAKDLAESGQPIAAARLLAWQYQNLDDDWEEIQTLNTALEYFYQGGDYESMRELAANAMERAKRENTDKFFYRSHVHYYLARYWLEEVQDHQQGLYHVDRCFKSKDSDIQDWCETKLETVKSEFVANLSTTVANNKLWYWLTFLALLAGMVVFVHRLLYSRPA